MTRCFFLAAACTASGLLPGCRERLKAVAAGGVEGALPDWNGASEKDDPAGGLVQRDDGRGSRAGIQWDIDPRPAAVSEEQARAAAHAKAANEQHLPIQAWFNNDIVGNSHGGDGIVDSATIRIYAEGPRSPEVAAIAAHVRCHADRMLANGDVPAVASSGLGPEWRFASRGRGSISWSREDEVLTLFAGQSTPGPQNPGAARQAAPGWVAAAGLTDAHADAAEIAAGPQSHPGVEVHGEARLEGRPVRWTMLFWRCLQRQKSFAAVVFSERAPGDSALLAARCHG